MRHEHLSYLRLDRSKPRILGTGKSRNKACYLCYSKNENIEKSVSPMRRFSRSHPLGGWRTKVSAKQSSLAVDTVEIQNQIVDFEPQLKVLVNKRFTNQTAPKILPQQEEISIKGQIRVSF